MSFDVAVYGLGYIGLPTACLLASRLSVVGIDVKPHVISSLAAKKSHIIEPGLDELLSTVVDSGNLQFSLTPQRSNVHVITVPTPTRLDSNERVVPDITYIEACCHSISSVLVANDLVILESTSPIGTTARIHSLIADLTGLPKESIYVAYCPERVIPGHTLTELQSNSRNLGGVCSVSTDLAYQFYRNFVKGPLFKCSAVEAELSKLVENSYRDVNLAFVNELSLLSDTLSIDPYRLISLVNHHPRVNLLNPGPGVGGHCIAVDPWFLVHTHPDTTTLIQKARHINNQKPHWVIKKIQSSIDQHISDTGNQPTLGILGLTYKPDVDDVRDSPSLYIANHFFNTYQHTLIHDPFAQTHLPITILNHTISADIVVSLVRHTTYLTSSIRPHLDFCGLLHS